MSEGIDKQFEFLKRTFDSLDSTTGTFPKKEQPEQEAQASPKSDEESALKAADLFGKIVIKTTKDGAIEFETKDTAKKTSRPRFFKRLTSKESYNFTKVVMNLDVKLRALIAESGNLDAEQLKKLKNWTENFNTFVAEAAKRKFRPKWFTFGMQKKQDTFIAQHQIGATLRKQVDKALQKAEKEKAVTDVDNQFFDLKSSWKTLSKDYRKKPSDLVNNLIGKIDKNVKQLDELIGKAKQLPPAEREKELPKLKQAMQKLEKQIELFRSAVPKFDESFTRYKDREKFKSDVVKQVWDDITQEMVENLSKQIDDPKATSIEESFIPLQEKIESLSPLLSFLDDFIEKTKGDQSLADLREKAKEVANAINEFVPNLLEPGHKALPLSLQSFVHKLREIDSFIEHTYTDRLAKEFGQGGSRVVAELRKEGYSALVECLEKAGEALKDTAGIRSLKFNPMIKQAEESLASLEAEYRKMKPILPLFPYAEGVIERIQGDSTLQERVESAIDSMKESFPNLLQSHILVLDNIQPFIKELQAIEQFIAENYTKSLEKEFGKDGPAIVAELRKEAYAALIECLDDVGQAFEKADEASTFEFKPHVKQAQARLGALKENLAKERQANKEFLQNVHALNARRQRATELAKKFHDSVQSGRQKEEVEAQATQKQKEPAKPTTVAKPAQSGTQTKVQATSPSVSSLVSFFGNTKKKLEKAKEALGDLGNRATAALDDLFADEEVPPPTPQPKPQVGRPKIATDQTATQIDSLMGTGSHLDDVRAGFKEIQEDLTELRQKFAQTAAKAKEELETFATDLEKVVETGADTISLEHALSKLAEIAESRGPDTIFSINPAKREKRRRELEEDVSRLERDVAKLQDDILELYKNQ